MSDRYTKSDVETAFKLFCSSFNLPMAKDYTEVGAYTLDKGHGGYVVIQLMERGGQSNPFGYTRRNAREMAQALRFAVDANFQAQKEGK